MNTYIVQPADGSAAYSVSAARYVFEPVTGRHLFYDDAADPDGGNLVANLINVSVRKEPSA